MLAQRHVDNKSDIPGFACFSSPNFSVENIMYGVLARSIGLGAVDADNN